MKQNNLLKVVFNDERITDNSKDYSNYISKSGIKIIKPIGRNAKKQLIWECQCGYCGKIFNDLPARILNGHKKSCGCLKTKNSGKRNIKIKYSFYDWCVENDHNDWLKLWDYSLNNKSPKEISYKTNHKYWFKCINQNDNHHSELHNISHIVDRGITNLRCNQCNSFAQWGIDNIDKNFLNKYWDYEKNKDIDPFNISYSCSKKVWIKCQDKKYHDSYYVMCNKFVDGCGCPYCNKNSAKIHKLDSLGYLYPEVIEIWSLKNKKSPYEYAPQSNSSVWFKCKNNKHSDYQQNISNAVNRGFRCLFCIMELKSSSLQNKVLNYLYLNYDYEVLNEFKCSLKPRNPKTGFILPFDNEIKDLKLIIEVNGEQHYKKNSLFNVEYAKRYGISLEDAFNNRVYLDNYKKMYALEKWYNYLEIPYTSEKDDYYKILIDNKIRDILKN